MSLTEAFLTESGGMRGLEAGANRVTEAYGAAAPAGFLKFRNFTTGASEITYDIGEMASTVLRPMTQAVYLRLTTPGVLGGEIMFAPGYFPTDTWFESNTLRWTDSTNGAINSGLAVVDSQWYILVNRVTATGVVTFSKWTQGVGWQHTTPTAPGSFGNPSWPSSGVLHFTSENGSQQLVCAALWDDTVLTNVQIETLEDDFAAWQTAAPSHLWRFDETTPNDLVGSCDVVSNTGTTIGTDSPLAEGTYVPPAPQAVKLDTNGDYLKRTGLVNAAAWTTSCWVRIDTNRHSYACIFGASVFTAIDFAGIDEFGTMLERSSFPGATQAVNLTVGTWYYVAITRTSGGVATLYWAPLGGGFQSVVCTNSAALTTSWDLWLGNCIHQYGGVNDSQLWGSVSQARMWTAALTQAELDIERASALAVKTANLWGDWPLNGDVNDVAGNARHFTTFGTVDWVPGPT